MTQDPAALRLVTYPAAVLRRKAAPVATVDDHVRAVARRMIEIMQQEDGVGLAAPQVGLPWRLFVCHVPEEPETSDEPRSASAHPITATIAPTVYINPIIADPRGELEGAEEGCLSLPNIRGEVHRPPIVTITALGLEGTPFTQTGTGLLARCWQHEMDHLDGVLIIDRMTAMSRLRVRSAVKALERKATPAAP